MASRTLRRRLCDGDVIAIDHEQLNTSGSPRLGEPLLENDGCNENYPKKEDDSNYQDIGEGQRKQHVHWTFHFSQHLAKWAKGIVKIVKCLGSLLKRFLLLPFISHNSLDAKDYSLVLSSLQEERLKNLQQRFEVPYDGTRFDHQEALMELWRFVFSNHLPLLKSEKWKEMGWQGPDPSTDFRGGGFIALENLIFFAEKYPDSFQRLLHKREGKRSEWEYPFAIAGINISFMLAQMLDLQSGRTKTMIRQRFLEILAVDEMAVDDLYCVAFHMMDH